MIILKDDFDVSAQIGFVQNEKGSNYTKEKYLNRIIFDKYIKDIVNKR